MDETVRASGFISVQWLIDYAEFNDAKVFGQTKWECLDEKLADLRDDFIEHVALHGIKVPVNYRPSTRTLMDGHHRVLLAWLLGIEFVPFDSSVWDEYDNGYPSCWGPQPLTS